MEHRDFYDILGLNSNATDREIKEAYRTLALKYHPDRNAGDAEAAEVMKSLNEAYAVLSNVEKRREYDALRQQFGSSAYGRFRHTYSDQDIFKGSDINQMFEEMARSFGLRGFDDIFKEFYGQGYRTFEFRQPGFSARGYVFTGPGSGIKAPHTLQFPGSGPLGKMSRMVFKKLSGIDLPEGGKDINDILYLSPEEARNGGSFPYLLRKKDKHLLVKIPQGVRDRQKIRLSGMGEDGKSGGAPGDLYLTIHIRTPFVQKIKDFVAGFIK